MKKIFCLILALLTLAASPALAQTLTIDLDTATIDELTAAQTQIADRISQLRAAAAPAGEAITLTGSGTSILSGVEVAAVPARITIEGEVQLTLSGEYDHTYNYELNAFACDVITEAETFDALVEGDGDWTITIQPIKEGGSVQASGTGPWVSDLFPLSSAAIVTVAVDPSQMDSYLTNASIQLYQPSSYSGTYFSDYVVSELLTPEDALTKDVIIKPEDGQVLCFWQIEVDPGVQWSINVK